MSNLDPPPENEQLVSTFPDHNKETPTTPHIQVIPAKRSLESWVWSFVQKRSRCCQILVEDDNGIKYKVACLNLSKIL